METRTLKVRKDGAINLGRRNRARLGILPGHEVRLTINNGVATLIPVGYRCSYCDKTTADALDIQGMCVQCEKSLLQYLRRNPNATFDQATLNVLGGTEK